MLSFIEIYAILIPFLDFVQASRNFRIKIITTMRNIET